MPQLYTGMSLSTSGQALLIYLSFLFQLHIVLVLLKHDLCYSMNLLQVEQYATSQGITLPSNPSPVNAAAKSHFPSKSTLDKEQVKTWVDKVENSPNLAGAVDQTHHDDI